MAKISCEFDTKEKTLSVMMDGTPVENAVFVNIGKSWENKDKFECCVTTSTENEDEDTYTVTRICASESDEGKVSNASESSKFKGFKEIASKVHKKITSDVLKYFGKK